MFSLVYRQYCTNLCTDNIYLYTNDVQLHWCTDNIHFLTDLCTTKLYIAVVDTLLYKVHHWCTDNTVQTDKCKSVNLQLTYIYFLFQYFNGVGVNWKGRGQ